MDEVIEEKPKKKKAVKKEIKVDDLPTAVKNYLDRKVPRVASTFWRRDKQGEAMTEHPLNKCRHSVAMQNWCQACGDEYLRASRNGK